MKKLYYTKNTIRFGGDLIIAHCVFMSKMCSFQEYRAYVDDQLICLADVGRMSV